jgi:hypothetical protein
MLLHFSLVIEFALRQNGEGIFSCDTSSDLCLEEYWVRSRLEDLNVLTGHKDLCLCFSHFRLGLNVLHDRTYVQTLVRILHRSELIKKIYKLNFNSLINLQF